MSVAGFTDSLKPQALRVPSCRRAGLDRIRSANLRERAPAKQKKQRGAPVPRCSLGVRGMQHPATFLLSLRTMPRSLGMSPQLYRRDHTTWVEALSHPPGRETKLIFPGWLPCGGIRQWDFVKPAVRAWENPTGRLHSQQSQPGNPRFEEPHPCFRTGLSRIASLRRGQRPL